MTTDIRTLQRRALVLVWIGLLWNVLEAVVALWSGASVGSVALIAFGFDSLIEIFAGSVLVWRLRRGWDSGEESDAERRAEQLIGATFFLLSAYILIQSAATLLGWTSEPQESLVGIALAVSSAIVMTVLFIYKRSIAERIGSRSLRAEAVESLVCDIQDLTLLIGLGANALLGWWWADPVAALFLIPWLVLEGKEALFDSDDD